MKNKRKQLLLLLSFGISTQMLTAMESGIPRETESSAEQTNLKL